MFGESLEKTRKAFFGKVATLVGATELTDDTWEDVEALLIQSDLGVETALGITERLRKKVSSEGITKQNEMVEALKTILLELLITPNEENISLSRELNVVLIVGVNGAGKTTSIAKLAHRYHNQSWDVILAAADTFRAAAVEQLRTWGERIDIPVIAGQTGGDAGAVVFDAVKAADARNKNLLLIDTAGRLHTKFNLMEELKKVGRVASKNVSDAPHEVWLVVDGTTGQNAVSQAKNFKDVVGVTGIIVTKLDGTAKGGMIFALNQEVGLPVRYVGIGESVDDLIPFDGSAFVDELVQI